MKIAYSPSFIREYNKLTFELQEEVRERISLFADNPTHSFLKTHKLKGRLLGRYSFSVNYSYRIVFCYLSKTEAFLLSVGDHDVYR